MKKLHLIAAALLLTAFTVSADPPDSRTARVNSIAYEASRVIKTGPGVLISISGYNSKASAQFIQLFDSTTVPADTAIPVAIITVPATSNFSYDASPYGIPFSTGIAISNSSTGPTKTAGGADVWYTAVVR